MEVILYMATTINGFIANESDDTDFTSEIEWDNFKEMIKNVGNMIIGRRTYEIMRDGGEFKNLENIYTLVISRNVNLELTTNNNLIVKTPKEALTILEKKGFTKALVAGGGTLNASFMAENLINEIYIHIEHTVFGKGIQLFKDKDFEADLKLLGTKKLSDNEIQLHYKVLK
jgi:dihydrofolate reductase